MTDLREKLSHDDAMFVHGILSALAIVHHHHDDVVFDEIVRSNNRHVLLGVARRSGQMRRSGMSDWLRRHRAEEGVR